MLYTTELQPQPYPSGSIQIVALTYHENFQKAAQFDLGLSVVLQRLSAVVALLPTAQSVLSEPYCWVGLQRW